MSTILILEDDPDLRNLYTRALKFQHYDVTATDSSEAALEWLETTSDVPDAAVLDMSMPGLPGSAVVEYIRHNRRMKHMPIVVISCDERFRHQLAGEQVLFMTKPINLSDLYSALARVV